MRYFSDEKLNAMKEKIRSEYTDDDRAELLAFLTRIELLDKRNDQYGDCREDLMTAISEMEKRTEKYVHRGQADPNDEDNDAYEYENY